MPCLQPSLVSILAICQRPSLKFLWWPRWAQYFSERMELQPLGPRPNSHRGGPQKSFDAFHQVLGCWVMVRLLAATFTMVHLPWKAKSAKALREVPANDPRATLEQVLHCVLALSWTAFDGIKLSATSGWWMISNQ